VCAWHIDDFEWNKLNPKWVSTRLSQVGELNGTWVREIKDSKIYWNGVNGGTETGHWGEKLTLPVDAPGDIKVEARIRHNNIQAGLYNMVGVGVNHLLSANGSMRYGVCMSRANIGPVNLKAGFNNSAGTPFPGFPSKLSQLGPADVITDMKIVRKNGYMFLYFDNLYVGQYAYATTITSVDLVALFFQAVLNSPKYVDWVKVTPSSVVL
jgi:hypothetical protein